MTHAIRRGVWLLGFVFMVCSFLLQSFALHVGRLSVVQPILTMELLFLVFILGTYFRFSISLREWIGASAIAFGLSGFLCFSDPGGGDEVPDQPGLDRGRGLRQSRLIVRDRGRDPMGATLVEGGHVRSRRRHCLRLHGRPHQDGQRLRRQRLGQPRSSTGRPTASSSSVCSASS